MKHWKRTLHRLLIQQSDQIQLLIIIPIITLAFLSLIVRTADSAVEPGLEKKRVTQQLKRRLNEVQNEALQSASANEPSPLALLLTDALQPTLTGELSTPMLLPQLTCEEQVESGIEPWREAFPPPVVWGVVDNSFVYGLKDGMVAGETMVGSALGVTPAPHLQSSSAQSRNPFLARFSCNRPGMKRHVQAEGKAARGRKVGVLFTKAIPGEAADQLTRRIVSLTVAFEHGVGSPDDFFGTVSGNFDGQMLSFGVLQWNLGSCSLQPLLRAFRHKDEARFRAIMEDGADFMKELLAAPCDEAPALAQRVMLDGEGDVKESWISRFRALGHEPAFQEVQLSYLLPHVQKAYALAEKFGFHSERAVALFFDILIQNGSIPRSVWAQYEHDKQEAERSLGRALDEEERMAILAHRQAESADPQWVKTVRARKLTIACGAGSVNGISYDLDALGIKLRPYRKGKAVALNNLSNPDKGSKGRNRLARRDNSG
ncbi:MAG: hypothetical protein ACRERD_24750 [Candidatus Binatia bacterium]